ncbi:helix-turn-helix domain-containing protein [Flavobacterium sp.]|uniref:helix-turn-helix domain-containing protein n=1 Tax=Flavobacterium sp. TaxID=239 RepID=UPI00374CDAC4
MKERVKSTSKAFDLECEDLPEINSKFVDMSLTIARYMSNFTKSKEFKQKDIADKLGKTEPEISKWFSGLHNLTLKSIIKLQLASPIKLLNPALFVEEKTDNTTASSAIVVNMDSHSYAKTSSHPAKLG